MDAIYTDQLTKDYGSGRGCKDITLSVAQGQVFGFLGPNGAGKSTFVKMLIGLTKPTKGKAHILGLPLGHLQIRRQIGYLPELFRYQEWLTAEEVLLFHAGLCGMNSSQAQKRIREMLHEVGLEERGGERVRHYSKGMQQRLGIACALLSDPDLIFFDEPSSALDPIGRHDVRRILLKLREQGKTVFLNTHLLEDVEILCDEVALLLKGEIKTIGKVKEIISPTKEWLFKVGGYVPEFIEYITNTIGIPFVVEDNHHSEKVHLRARIPNVEQVGWINSLLIAQGFTLYEVRPLENKLDDWFLQLASQKGDQSK